MCVVFCSKPCFLHLKCGDICYAKYDDMNTEGSTMSSKKVIIDCKNTLTFLIYYSNLAKGK